MTRPRRAAPPYIAFTTAMIPKLKASEEYKGPGEKYGWKLRADGEEMKHTDFMGIAAAKWGALSEAERAPYEALAEKDRQRYEVQLAEWKEKGYYTMADGQKSTVLAKGGKVEETTSEMADEPEEQPDKIQKKKAKK